MERHDHSIPAFDLGFAPSEPFKVLFGIYPWKSDRAHWILDIRVGMWPQPERNRDELPRD